MNRHRTSLHTSSAKAAATLIASFALAACGAHGEAPTDEGDITGSVVVAQYHLDLPQSRAREDYVTIRAAFSTPATADAARATPPECAPVTYGACVLRRCASSSTGRLLTPSTTAAVSAGTVSVLGLHEGVDLTAQESGAYDHTFAQGARWTGGELVTVRVSGAERGVPAFSLAVETPTPISVQSPSRGRPVPTDAPLAVRWTGGDGATVRVVIAGYDAPFRVVTCEFDGDDGAGEVPAEAMASLAGLPYAQLAIVSEHHKIVRVGDHVVSVATIDAAPGWLSPIR